MLFEMAGEISVQVEQFLVLGGYAREPFLGLREFELKKMNVLFTLAENVRGSRYIQECSGLGFGLHTANADEEMRLVRGSASAIDTGFRLTKNSLRRREHEGFQPVL